MKRTGRYTISLVNDIESSNLNVYLKAYLLNVTENLLVTEMTAQELKSEKDLTEPKLLDGEVVPLVSKENEGAVLAINELKDYKGYWKARVINADGSGGSEKLASATFRVKPDGELADLFLDIINLADITNIYSEDGAEARECFVFDYDISDDEAFKNYDEPKAYMFVCHSIVMTILQNIVEKADKYNLSKGLAEKCIHPSIINRDFKMLEDAIRDEYDPRFHCALDRDDN